MENPESESEKNLDNSNVNVSKQTISVTMGKYRLEIDSFHGTWSPTPNAIVLGELLSNQDFRGKRVLELGTGVGLHAIVIAAQGAETVTVTDLDQDVLDNAEANIENHRQVFGYRTLFEYVIADWVDVPGRSTSGEAPWDAVVSNPPFAIAVRDHKKPNLHWFLDRFIEEAPNLVTPGGEFYCVQTSMADFLRTKVQLQKAGIKLREQDQIEEKFPFRDYYFEDPDVPEGESSRYWSHIKALPLHCYTVKRGEVPKSEIQKRFCRRQCYETVIAFKGIISPE